MTVLAEVQALPLAVFGLVLAVTLGITFWASRRTSTATEFFAAGRGISGFQNGWAIAGDYMSASTFLGFAGLIFLFGVDAFVGLAAAIVSFLVVLLFLAERMRNAGKYTLADVLSFRLRERPARMAAALGTLAVASVYLVAQMVGGGVLIQALTGVSFTPAVIAVGAFMLALRDLRRHAGDDLGADHQGRPADVGRRRADGVGARRVRLQPLRDGQPGGGAASREGRLPAARASSSPRTST